MEVFTIAAANYLSRALLALESHRENSPLDDEYHLVLCERPEVVAKLRTPKDVKVRSMYEVGLPDPERMAFQYDLLELATSIKPFVFRDLFASGAKAVTYIDPDTFWMGTPYSVESRGDACDALVTPHLVDDRYDGFFPDWLQTLKSGQMNFGYLSLRNTPNANGFLAWWADVLLSKCVKDYSNGVFVDQSWGQAIFSLMDRVEVERTHGSHCAYWNVRAGDVGFDGKRYTMRGEPMTMFHFSGFDPFNPARLSGHSERFNPLPDPSALRGLALEYSSRVKTLESLWPAKHLPYSFAEYADGRPVLQAERRAVLAKQDMSSRGVFKAPPVVLDEPTGFREAYVRRTWQLLGTLGHAGRPLKVAIYGAGKHTDWLAHTVTKCDPRPLVVAVLDDGPVKRPAQFGLQRTSLPKEHAAAPVFDAVVLSTDVPANAERMRERARAVFGKKVKVYNLYEGCPPGQYV